MKRKTTVNIYDMEFTLVGEESEEYVQKVAGLVDTRMREVSESGLSVLSSAVLAAANIADDYYKALDQVEDMKNQMRGYFEEISRLKDELDEQRRAVRAASAGAPRGRNRALAAEAEAAKKGSEEPEQLELDK